MRPIAILQHEATQGPGVLRDHLDDCGYAYRLIVPTEEGHAPIDASQFSAIVVLGSDHSVNEELPWMAEEMRLLQDALRRNTPVLGHCFGAQMLARAMGAQVRRHVCPNIGWSQVWVPHSRFAVSAHGTGWYSCPSMTALPCKHYRQAGIIVHEAP